MRILAALVALVALVALLPLGAFAHVGPHRADAALGHAMNGAVHLALIVAVLVVVLVTGLRPQRALQRIRARLTR